MNFKMNVLKFHFRMNYAFIDPAYSKCSLARNYEQKGTNSTCQHKPTIYNNFLFRLLFKIQLLETSRESNVLFTWKLRNEIFAWLRNKSRACVPYFLTLHAFIFPRSQGGAKTQEGSYWKTSISRRSTTLNAPREKVENKHKTRR